MVVAAAVRSTCATMGPRTVHLLATNKVIGSIHATHILDELRVAQVLVCTGWSAPARSGVALVHSLAVVGLYSQHLQDGSSASTCCCTVCTSCFLLTFCCFVVTCTAFGGFRESSVKQARTSLCGSVTAGYERADISAWPTGCLFRIGSELSRAIACKRSV